MATPPLTLMAVHAHPDDEATSTGGVLARYAAEGVRTVLVTCTDGGCGDGPGGTKPGDAGHDHATVVAAREQELRRSCDILRVGHLELLGYRDSGMMGWDANAAPGAFWGMEVAAAAEPLAGLMRRYRPHVVVTYDANGFYGHPDHIMAHRIATAAADATGIPDKLYHTAIARSGLGELAAALREAGIEPPGASDREEGQFAAGPGAPPAGADATDPDAAGSDAAIEPPFGTPDGDITTRVDVSGFTDAKFAALAAHGSQADNIFFLRMGADLYRRFFSEESFVRAYDRTGAPTPEDDLFAGLR